MVVELVGGCSHNRIGLAPWLRVAGAVKLCLDAPTDSLFRPANTFAATLGRSPGHNQRPSERRPGQTALKACGSLSGPVAYIATNTASSAGVSYSRRDLTTAAEHSTSTRDDVRISPQRSSTMHPPDRCSWLPEGMVGLQYPPTEQLRTRTLVWAQMEKGRRRRMVVDVKGHPAWWHSTQPDSNSGRAHGCAPARGSCRAGLPWGNLGVTA